jgi:hypothetical protein
MKRRAQQLRKHRASRIKACKLAAKVMAGRPDDQVVPMLWSLCVFFENYIDCGAKWTQKDFGPKKPVKLRVASQ